jgi:hypothetical protein
VKKFVDPDSHARRLTLFRLSNPSRKRSSSLSRFRLVRFTHIGGSGGI